MIHAAQPQQMQNTHTPSCTYIAITHLALIEFAASKLPSKEDHEFFMQLIQRFSVSVSETTLLHSEFKRFWDIRQSFSKIIETSEIETLSYNTQGIALTPEVSFFVDLECALVSYFENAKKALMT